MIVEKKLTTADEMRISIAGRIDVTTSPQLREEIAAIPPAVKKIVLDFSDVSYISSSGIRELFVCKKKFPNTAIENVASSVFDVFKMTGCDKIFSISAPQRMTCRLICRCPSKIFWRAKLNATATKSPLRTAAPPTPGRILNSAPRLLPRT